MIEHALRYAQRGIPVFPVSAATKAPLTSQGFKNATADEARVIALWKRVGLEAGIGIPTGAPSGIAVIDIDPRNGGDKGLERAIGDLGPLPETVMVRTPSGGWHYWFGVPDGVTIPNSAGKLGRRRGDDSPPSGVDVRGDGGYVVAPPTRTPAGAAWSWMHRDSTSLALFPAPWLEAASAGRQATARAPLPPSTWTSMLSGPIGEGERNVSLTRLMGHLLGKGVDPHVAAWLVSIVNDARCRPPLEPDEVDRIVESIASRELRKRRST